jgi:hypothetical protein
MCILWIPNNRQSISKTVITEFIFAKDGSYWLIKSLRMVKLVGITAVDYDDVSFNKNGVYKVESFLNGKPILVPTRFLFL